MMHLSLAGKNNVSPQGILCVSLSHNELAILPEFLRHYRSLGITSFAMVDDRSTDDTRQLLLSQDDVTVFTPTEGSTYRLHQGLWRKEILDAFGSGRWCLVADIDEHFVYPDMETKPVADLAEELDREGSRALLTLMIDMYADRPVPEQGRDRPEQALLQAFPYFDAPRPRTNNYYLVAGSQVFPAPPYRVYGGFRSRMLASRDGWWRAARRNAARQCLWGIQNLANNGRPRHRKRQKHPLLNRLLHSMRAELPLPPCISKLGLVKWQRDLKFPSGTHMVNKPIRCSGRIAAFLHYYFAHGIDRFHYIVEKGSHFRNSSEYVEFLRATEGSDRSPVCGLSARYSDSRSLKGLMR